MRGVIPSGITYDHVVFFFQAEDGIRDRNVTGVQTCALPISLIRWSRARTGSTARPPGRRASRPPCAAARSEERRVGKSVDLGGRRISKKKNKKTRNDNK